MALKNESFYYEFMDKSHDFDNLFKSYRDFADALMKQFLSAEANLTIRNCESFSVVPYQYGKFLGSKYNKEAIKSIMSKSEAASFEAMSKEAMPQLSEAKYYDDWATEYSEISDFIFEDIADGLVRVSGYKGLDTNVVVPPFDNFGNIVTEIKAGIFAETSVVTLILPNTIFEIPDACFANNNLSSIILSTGTSKIGEYAFSDCKVLNNVYLPNTITSIGYRAFSGCSAIRTIELPSALKDIGGVLGIGNACFYRCESLSSIQIPKTISTIPLNCFYGCISLTDIDIPANITILDTSCFEASGLAHLTLHEGLLEIGASAFAACQNLKSFYLPRTINKIGEEAFSGCISLSSIYTDENYVALTDIGANAFSGCISLIRFYLPNGIKRLGAGVFRDCESLTECVFSDEIELDGINSENPGVQRTAVTIPDDFFYGCKRLKRFILPRKFKYLGQRCFWDCFTGYGIENDAESEIAYFYEITDFEQGTVSGDLSEETKTFVKLTNAIIPAFEQGVYYSKSGSKFSELDETPGGWYYPSSEEYYTNYYMQRDIKRAAFRKLSEATLGAPVSYVYKIIEYGKDTVANNEIVLNGTMSYQKVTIDEAEFVGITGSIRPNFKNYTYYRFDETERKFKLLESVPDDWDESYSMYFELSDYYYKAWEDGYAYSPSGAQATEAPDIPSDAHDFIKFKDSEIILSRPYFVGKTGTEPLINNENDSEESSYKREKFKHFYYDEKGDLIWDSTIYDQETEKYGKYRPKDAGEDPDRPNKFVYVEEIDDEYKTSLIGNYDTGAQILYYIKDNQDSFEELEIPVSPTSTQKELEASIDDYSPFSIDVLLDDPRSTSIHIIDNNAALNRASQFLLRFWARIGDRGSYHHFRFGNEILSSWKFFGAENITYSFFIEESDEEEYTRTKQNSSDALYLPRGAFAGSSIMSISSLVGVLDSAGKYTTLAAIKGSASGSVVSFEMYKKDTGELMIPGVDYVLSHGRLYFIGDESETEDTYELRNIAVDMGTPKDKIYPSIPLQNKYNISRVDFAELMKDFCLRTLRGPKINNFASFRTAENKLTDVDIIDRISATKEELEIMDSLGATSNFDFLIAAKDTIETANFSAFLDYVKLTKPPETAFVALLTGDYNEDAIEIAEETMYEFIIGDDKPVVEMYLEQEGLVGNNSMSVVGSEIDTTNIFDSVTIEENFTETFES